MKRAPCYHLTILTLQFEVQLVKWLQFGPHLLRRSRNAKHNVSIVSVSPHPTQISQTCFRRLKDLHFPFCRSFSQHCRLQLLKWHKLCKLSPDTTPFQWLRWFQTAFRHKLQTHTLWWRVHRVCGWWHTSVLPELATSCAKRMTHADRAHGFLSFNQVFNRISRSCNSCLVRLPERSFWLMKSAALRHKSKLVKSRACIQFRACWPILAIVGHEERQVHYLGSGCGKTGRPKAPALLRRDPCLGVPCSCSWFDFNDLPYHLNSQPYHDLIIPCSTLGLYQTCKGISCFHDLDRMRGNV